MNIASSNAAWLLPTVKKHTASDTLYSKKKSAEFVISSLFFAIRMPPFKLEFILLKHKIHCDKDFHLAIQETFQIPLVYMFSAFL